jgi:hypothetical protein
MLAISILPEEKWMNYYEKIKIVKVLAAIHRPFLMKR